MSRRRLQRLPAHTRLLEPEELANQLVLGVRIRVEDPLEQAFFGLIDLVLRDQHRFTEVIRRTVDGDVQIARIAPMLCLRVRLKNRERLQPQSQTLVGVDSHQQNAAGRWPIAQVGTIAPGPVQAIVSTQDYLIEPCAASLAARRADHSYWTVDRHLIEVTATWWTPKLEQTSELVRGGRQRGETPNRRTP